MFISVAGVGLRECINVCVWAVKKSGYDDGHVCSTEDGWEMHGWWYRTSWSVCMAKEVRLLSFAMWMALSL